jgi:hypothetical protein
VATHFEKVSELPGRFALGALINLRGPGFATKWSRAVWPNRYPKYGCILCGLAAERWNVPPIRNLGRYLESWPHRSRAHFFTREGFELTRHKSKERIAMNRPGGKVKLAAGLLVGVLLVGFSLPGRAQTAPPGATIVQRMATQSPAPLPHKGFLDSDYELLIQGGSGQEVMVAYMSPSANQRTVRYSLLSWARTSLFAQIEADEVNRRNASFGSTELAIADSRMPADVITPHFRPLLEIPLGAYKLPISVYVPNPQANQPSW